MTIAAMDSSIYENNRFRVRQYLPEGYKAVHFAVFLIRFTNRFKTVAKFRLKLLLIGFMFASIFTFVAT